MYSVLIYVYGVLKMIQVLSLIAKNGNFIKNHNSSKDEKLTFLDLTVSACLGSAVRLRGVTVCGIRAEV